MAKKPIQNDEVLLEVDAPGGMVKAKLRVPKARIRLADLARSIMPLDDEFVRQGEELELSGGREVSCQKGCGACCRQVVPVSPPEAWMLADMVLAMPIERRRELIPRFIEADELLQKSGLKDKLLGRIDRRDQLREIGLEYFRLGIACPFLEEESCSIHTERPSICREYLVTSPASNCAVLGTKSIRRVPVAVRLSEALANVSAKVLGGEPQVIPLTLALDWADEHAADGRRMWDARVLLESLVEELRKPPVT
jgi:Fe-S-cluster containining protein